MMFIFSLKMFIRNLIANRSYHLVNIAGLYIGLTGSILLGMYVQEELTYDQHFLGFDRIYRVVGERIVSNDSNIAAPVSPLLGSFLTQDFPIVESFVRFTPEDRSVFQSEDVSAFWKTYTWQTQMYFLCLATIYYLAIHQARSMRLAP